MLQGHLALLLYCCLFSEGGETGAGFDSIEQHFSDWSDNDSDDDILNQPDQVI